MNFNILMTNRAIDETNEFMAFYDVEAVLFHSSFSRGLRLCMFLDSFLVFNVKRASISWKILLLTNILIASLCI